ncbi:MAG: hypothetical protein KatS3mg002_0958 [Candidatus Woesearchaeota archaeon]|nr:MAG: hypothetical protein KatS3mg002_0958 [Candidatus Woesearchaeota archaeon]
MPDYSKGLTYNEEHEKIYEKMLNAVPLDYRIKKTIKHRDAFSESLKIFQGKEFTSLNEGIEALTDALIMYRKKAGMPVSDDKEHRHNYVSEVREFLNAYSKEAGKDVLNILKQGDIHTVFLQLVEADKARDLEGKVDYELRKILPEGKDMEFYKGIVHYHAKLNPSTKFTKGEIARLSSYEGILNLLKRSYQLELENKIKEYKPKKDEEKKSNQLKKAA